jgi:predicted nucleic acid-binding protein
VIVVDTSVLAYAVVPGERTDAALALLAEDPAWVAPGLWRYELQNVLATLVRIRKVPVAKAMAAFRAAERLVSEPGDPPAVEACLRVSASTGISAYDAQFVCLAESLEVRLVTADRKLVRAFPGRAVLLG